MIEKTIEVQTADGVADGFLYQPSERGSWPGVIHLTDIFGIRASHRQMASRLAAQGYVVMLPNVFYRFGKTPVVDFPIKIGEERTTKRIGELRASLPLDAIERDAPVYVRYLARQDSVSTGPMGVIGFCFTGSMALRTAALAPDKIAAAASFHGGGLYTAEPTSPHLLLPRIKARLYFGHAIEDRSMPKEIIEKFEGALASWGGRYESETYEGAHHGWTVPDSHAYNEPQAERAFAKLTDLLSATLHGQRARATS
jgi:carboxymethylenebutenolidase